MLSDDCVSPDDELELERLLEALLPVENEDSTTDTGPVMFSL